MYKNMQAKRLSMLDHYPREYRRALKNTLDQRQLTEYLQSGPVPLFLVGPLMLPSFLKAMTSADNCMDQAIHMTQASLLWHKLYLFEGLNLPLLKQSDQMNDYVDGMLVFNLSEKRRDWICQLEASEETQYEAVQVEITLQDGSLCMIDAGAYLWTRDILDGIVPAKRKEWLVDEFIESTWYKSTTVGYGSC